MLLFHMKKEPVSLILWIIVAFAAALFQYIVSCLTDSFLSSCGSLLLYHIIKAF